MKIISASVKVIDDKNHVSILTLTDIESITLKGPNVPKAEKQPPVKEPPKEKKKLFKKKNKK